MARSPETYHVCERAVLTKDPRLRDGVVRESLPPRPPHHEYLPVPPQIPEPQHDTITIEQLPQPPTLVFDRQVVKDPYESGYSIVRETLLGRPDFKSALEYGEEPMKAKSQVLEGLAELYEHDKGSFEHTMGVVKNAAAIAERLNLPPERKALLLRAAMRHDEEKAKIRNAVLQKEGELTPEEFEEMKSHVEKGYAKLVQPGDLRTARVMVGHHQMQERAYPPEPALDESMEDYDLQIYLAMADVKDALGKRRSYKEEWEESQIMQKLQQRFGERLLRLYKNMPQPELLRDEVMDAVMYGNPREEVALAVGQEIPIFARVMTA